MDLNIRALSPQTSGALEASAATSVFWELPCDETNTPSLSADPTFDKQLWIHKVLMEWGICGYTAYVGTGGYGSTPLPAASVFFAPANYFPGARALPSGPVSPDAILLSNVFVALPFMGLYLEHQLIDTVLTEARRRGVKAVEAFARLEQTSQPDPQPRRSGDYQPEAYRGWEERRQSRTGDQLTDLLSIAPILTEDILEAQGFQVVAAHSHYPRYRYEIETENSLFSAFAADPHTQANEEKPLPTVLGGQKRPQPVATMKDLLDQAKSLDAESLNPVLPHEPGAQRR